MLIDICLLLKIKSIEVEYINSCYGYRNINISFTSDKYDIEATRSKNENVFKNFIDIIIAYINKNVDIPFGKNCNIILNLESKIKDDDKYGDYKVYYFNIIKNEK